MDEVADEMAARGVDTTLRAQCGPVIDTGPTPCSPD